MPRLSLKVAAHLPKGFHNERYRQLIQHVVEARGERGLSQAQVAALLGTHQQFVSRYETGERRLDVIEFIDVCAALRLNVQDMFGVASAKLRPDD